MSFSKWQKLIAARTRNAVLSVAFAASDAAVPGMLVLVDTFF